jgi:hypothetical protein
MLDKNPRKIILKFCNLFHFPCIIIVKDLSEPEKGGAMDKEKIDYIAGKYLDSVYHIAVNYCKNGMYQAAGINILKK